MSRPTHRASRLLAITLPVAASVAGLLPAAGNAAAYNVGVAELHFAAATDACVPDQALPCTLNAGSGDANVLRVLQTQVDGYHQFTTLEGTSQLDETIWVAAEIGARCRQTHHLTSTTVDGDLSNTDLDGFWDGDLPNVGGEGDAGTHWPQWVSTPHAKEMPTKTIATHVPIAVAFDPAMPLVDFFPTVDDVLDAGEAEIQRRMDNGMTAAEARAIPYELNTAITIAAEVVCVYNGGFSAEYFKRKFASIPLTIEYVPVEVPDPVGDLPPVVDDVTDRARVTDAELVVIPDPADPCTLHLSGVISTNRETDVEYRFINQYGQPSNTYTVHVGDTQVAMVDRSVEVPHADVVDIDGDLAPTPGHGEVGGLATEAGPGTGQYTGTYELEIVSPNHLLDADGFSVPYCEAGDPVIDPSADDVVAEPDPTHSDPTVPPAPPTLPPVVVTPTIPPTNAPHGSAIPLPPTPTVPSTTTSTIPPVATVTPVVVGVVLLAPTTTAGN